MAKPRTEGPAVIRFIERHCRLTRGPYSGQLVKLLDFQKELINDLFTLGVDGLRRYRQALIMLARKNGKTYVLACVALYEAVTGEPGGEVYFVAGDRQQARRAFDECRRLVEMDAELSDLFQVYRNYMEIPSSGTVLRVLSSDAGLQQGLNPSFVCFDEVAVQKTADLWHAMTLGSGARTQALVVGISTPGYSKDSLLGRLYDYGKRIEAGEMDDDSFYFRAWEPSDPAADHTDPAVWAEANPALGHFLHREDFVSAVKKTPENDFRRFRLGQWVTSLTAALPRGAWDACADPEKVTEGDVVLYLDGTFRNECTVLVGVTLGETPHVFLVDDYEAPDEDPDRARDSSAVIEAVVEAHERYGVHTFGTDLARWGREARELEARGITVVEIPGSPERLRTAWQQLYTAIIEKRLTHDGSDVLARHFGNLVVQPDPRGERPTRDQSSPTAFSHGAFAAILAHGHAQATDVAPTTPLVAWVE